MFLQVAEGSHLTPLPIEEDVSSLSAILLDNDYYDFIRTGRQEIDGLPMVGAAQLIALKARAWLDLTEREKRGEKIDSKTIKKHKNDVFRLYQILDPAGEPAAPEAVKRILANSSPECAARKSTSRVWAYAAHATIFLQKSQRFMVSQKGE